MRVDETDERARDEHETDDQQRRARGAPDDVGGRSSAGHTPLSRQGTPGARA